ncbi:MAG: sulfite exporter TauE/SafE family protein [Clostridiales Family XIII bacterium]|jgi:uncharacterized membrane protein YfcA|nr:sulfite exporter TauE/SafE family protein [Clostridiales Family XIII bacterium]
MKRKNIAIFCGLGLLTGFLAGFFGIGGGGVIVPVLVAFGFSQRSAAATSLLAILPTAVAGVVTYIVGGEIDYAVAVVLACGVVIGAQIGTKLLSILPERWLRWSFAVFILVLSAAQFLLVSSRGTDIALNVFTVMALVALGVVTGTLSGLLGVGGGFLMVTGLTFILGGSDVAARGISLFTMIPGTISGTVRNLKNELVNIKVGLVIGACSCITPPLGKLALEHLTPKAASVSVGIYLVALFIRSIYVAARSA